MGRPRATLKDIAEAAGFSLNTVSLALRGSPRLPEKTREVILKEARRLNYYPNRIARSLASSASKTIGLVVTDVTNPTLTMAAHTIERELSEAGYAVMFATSGGRTANEKRAIELFLSYLVDGILVYPADRKQIDHIQAADAAGTPVVLLVDVPDSGLDVVSIDLRAGAFRAFELLCEAGHRQFALLDGGLKVGNTDKSQGAMEAIRQAGLSPDSLTVLAPDGQSAASGYAMMEKVMALDPRPTAVFATNDILALGVLHWCRENGVAVPEDMAVMGYDNTEVSAYGAVPLTTVNYAADEISRLGVGRILSRIRCPDSWNGPERQLIMPELVLRGSV